jgi:hypothetical protein
VTYGLSSENHVFVLKKDGRNGWCLFDNTNKHIKYFQPVRKNYKKANI